jgi:hypothetical protein
MFVEIVALMLNPLLEEVKSLKTKSVFFHIWRGNEIHKPLLEAGVSRAYSVEYREHFQAHRASSINMLLTISLLILVI